MFVLLREDSQGKQVINVLFGDDVGRIRKWIEDYLQSEINSYAYMPLKKDTRNVSYSYTCNGEDTYKLIKSYKQIHKGYVYNTSDKVQEVIYTIKFLEYQTKDCMSRAENGTLLWNDINAEINNRVLKQLDKESLYQVMTEVHDRISFRGFWDKSEYTHMVTEVLKDFKKESYSTVVKRMKRFGSKKPKKS
jgi:hypothetical protein